MSICSETFPAITESMILSSIHVDVIKWIHFLRCWSLCEGNPPVTGGFPSQRPVTRRFDVFFDLRLNKCLSRQSRRRLFETSSRSLWRQCNAEVVAQQWLLSSKSRFHRSIQLWFFKLFSSIPTWICHRQRPNTEYLINNSNGYRSVVQSIWIRK